MLTNYSISNKPSFGNFLFHEGAKNVIKDNIKKEEDLDKFEKLCEQEKSGARKYRTINVSASFKNGSYSGNKLTANPGDKWHTQGLFQSPLSFLEKMMKKADKIQAEQIKKTRLAKDLDSIMNDSE